MMLMTIHIMGMMMMMMMMISAIEMTMVRLVTTIYAIIACDQELMPKHVMLQNKIVVAIKEVWD